MFHRKKSLTDEEHFRCGDDKLQISVLNYWQRACNDLTNRMGRGTFAEFLVQAAIYGKAPKERLDSSYDIEGPDGLRIDVKSSALYDHSGKRYGRRQEVVMCNDP